MARREMDGRRRGTMATASCEKSTRPHDTSADHNTSHGDLRSRWSSDASLLIAASQPSGSQEPSITLEPGDPAGVGTASAVLGFGRDPPILPDFETGIEEGIEGDAGESHWRTRGGISSNV
jgi:hypothetical protein